MAAIARMIRLDVITMKPQRWSFVMIPALILFFAIQSPSAMTPMFTAAWTTALLAPVIFAVQERDNLRRLYGSLPLTPRHIVMGRFGYCVTVFASAMIFAIAAIVIASLIRGAAPNAQPMVFSAFVGLGCFAVIISFQLPIFFRFGYTKGRLWGMLPFLCLFAVFLIPGADSWVSHLNASANWGSVSSMVVIGMVSAVLLALSTWISIRVYRNQQSH